MLHLVAVYKTGQELCTFCVEELPGRRNGRPRKSCVRGKLKEEYGSLEGATYEIKCHLFISNHDSV